MAGIMWIDFPDEYDFNRRTRATPPKGVNGDGIPDAKERLDRHTITVGDLCFVALGQIVNRQSLASRGYGPLPVEELNKIPVGDTKVSQFHLECIEAISRSQEPMVRKKLLEIIQATAHEKYFIAALPALDRSHVW